MEDQSTLKPNYVKTKRVKIVVDQLAIHPQMRSYQLMFQPKMIKMKLLSRMEFLRIKLIKIEYTVNVK